MMARFLADLVTAKNLCLAQEPYMFKFVLFSFIFFSSSLISSPTSSPLRTSACYEGTTDIYECCYCLRRAEFLFV